MNEKMEHWEMERTISSIGQIVKSEYTEGLDTKFGRKRVLIDAGSDWVTSANAQMVLTLAVNILNRLYPVITDIDILLKGDVISAVVLPRLGREPLKVELQRLIELVGSPTNTRIVEECRNDYDAILGIGNSLHSGGFVINVGSDGWLCYLSQNNEVTFGERINPVGAYAAAALGCAEVFKWVLAQTFSDALSLPIRYVSDLKFSTFDYSMDLDAKVNPELPGVVDVGQTSIIGVGAGGGAIVYTLSSLKHLSGIINLVDPDTIKPSNLNRYVWAFWDDANRQAKKVDVAYSLFSSSHKGLQMRRFFGPYIHFTDELRKAGGMDLVISTVDTGRARQDIQWDIPRVILDGSTTGHGDYVILRVYFGAGQCLGCKHMGGSGEENRLYQVLSEKIGLSPQVIEQLKKDGLPFSEEHIAQMRVFLARQEANEFALPEVGMSFSDWYREQCGRLKLPELKETEAPIPFVPTMAGILLASEIIKERHFPESVIRNRFAHNMLNVPSHEFLYFRKPRTDCIVCQDAIMQKRYKEIWLESKTYDLA